MQDQEWTKKALLFWDRIATIVPKNIDLTSFPDTAFHDLVAAGALQPWAVSSEIRSEVTESAVQMIDSGVHLQFPPGEPFPINFGKMTAELHEALTERDLVRGATPTDLLLDRNVALMVLTLLAHRLAEATNAQPLTDDSDLASCYLHVGQANNRTHAALTIVQRDLELAIPDLRNIELPAWLKFREQHRPALEMYRSGLRQLARDVTHAAEPDEVEEILKDREQDLANTMDEKKSVFKTLTSDNTWTTLRIVVEIGTTAPVNPLIAAALLGVEAAAYAAKQFRRKELHHLSFVQAAGKRFNK